MTDYVYIEDGEMDAYLFHEGTYIKSYEFLGAHPIFIESKIYVRFVVWAPRAREVYLIGDFNNWNDTSLPMKRIGKSGLWNICVEGVEEYQCYKYRIISQTGEVRIKADPYAFHAEERPKTASKYYDIRGYNWKDKVWMKSRKKEYDKPISIYEVNLMSWRKKENNNQYSYRELADELVDYAKEMGFTHIELMPIAEHPYDGSWGYQVSGYFAPTSRFGTPKDFMYFVNQCHKKNIGVILDWVPLHFCRDDFALERFDGSYCFESMDLRKSENQQWGTSNFDFTKPEVISFLISSAIYWLENYHIDGLRVDAVAYMLYYDFTGKNIKNKYGGRENLEAIEFLKKLNTTIEEYFPEVIVIAEESTTWPKISYPVKDDGLGFDYKWNMGWMNDMLEYMQTDPFFRKGNQQALTFSLVYAFSERFILPLSHDEVVHGKKSLLDKMPGNYDEKFANLRLLYLFMFAHPGKKLIFMGGEFGQFIEWNEWKQLDWFLLEYEMHSKTREYFKELNKFYSKEDTLYDLDTTYDGFKWIEHTNHQESIVAFERINSKGEKLIAAFNFTPVERNNYPLGVDEFGVYRTIINSDHKRFGGNTARVKSYKSQKEPIHGREYQIRVNLPPLGGLYLKFKK